MDSSAESASELDFLTDRSLLPLPLSPGIQEAVIGVVTFLSTFQVGLLQSEYNSLSFVPKLINLSNAFAALLWLRAV